MSRKLDSPMRCATAASGPRFSGGAIERVRIVRHRQRVRGAPGSGAATRYRTRCFPVGSAIQQPRRLLEATEPLMQKPSSSAASLCGSEVAAGSRIFTRLVVRAARDRETPQDRRRSRIVRRTRLGERFRFRRTAVRDRATRRARKRLVRRRVLRAVAPTSSASPRSATVPGARDVARKTRAACARMCASWA